MTVAAANLTTSGNVADLASYVTASVTPGANRLVLVWVTSWVGAGTANAPTVSGNGLTYVQVATATDGAQGRSTLLRTLGAAPSTGAITIDFAGQTQSACGWSVVECTGMDVGGSNGSAAIVQAVAATGASSTTFTITLGAFSDPRNATLGGLAQAADGAMSVGSGFNLLGTFGTSASLITEWRVDNDTTVDATSTATNGWSGVAIEVKAAIDAGWSLYRPYTLGADVNSLVSGLWYYWRRRKQEKPDE